MKIQTYNKPSLTLCPLSNSVSQKDNYHNSINKDHNHRAGFTLSELLVVIMIIAILAAVVAPMLKSKVDNAKWSEANATAGTIRSAISAYVAQHSITEAQAFLIDKKLSNTAVQNALGFTAADLTGTYFVPDDYKITTIDDLGHAAITVTASQENAPTGSKTLDTDGNWR